MFKEVSLGVKIITFINAIINLLLLIPLFTFVRFVYGPSFIIGLSVVVINIVLGIWLIFLNKLVRLSFIIMQTVGLVFSIWPFLCILALGMNGASFGENHVVPWGPIHTSLFWKQLAFFVYGMSFPTAPMLFSIFCIIYLNRPKVKEQFK